MPHDFTSAHVLDLGTHEPPATIFQGVLGDLDAFIDGAGVTDEVAGTVAQIGVAVQHPNVVAHARNDSTTE